MFQTSNQAIAYLCKQKGKGAGFERIKELLKDLGLHQPKYRIVHIAGTNGKGTVCYCLARCLEEQGYKVGLFTSPAYLNQRDRIRVNQQWIQEDKLLDYMNEYEVLFDQEHLCMFEMDFLLACRYFQDQQVDIAIFETGIGGLLDPTNAFEKTDLSIITTVGMDHQALLGNTIEEIAYQKAGIIKQNGQVLVGKLDENVMNIVVQECNKKHATLHTCLPYEKLENNHMRFMKEEFCLYNHASYFYDNLSLALSAYLLLTKRNNLHDLKEIVSKLQWSGRFECVCTSPYIFLDGAHNMPAAKALYESLCNYPRPWILVFAAMKDKDVTKMAHFWLEHVDDVILTQIDMTRCYQVKDDTLFTKKEEDYRVAIKKAIQQANGKGTIVCCGSLYFISELASHMELFTEDEY